MPEFKHSKRPTFGLVFFCVFISQNVLNADFVITDNCSSLSFTLCPKLLNVLALYVKV